MEAGSLIIFLGLFGLGKSSSVIDVQVDAKKAADHIADSLDLFIYVSLLSLTILTLWILKAKKITFLHESGLAITYGLLVGLLLRMTGSSNRSVSILRVVPFNITGPHIYFQPSQSNTKKGHVLPDELLIDFKISDDDNGDGGNSKQTFGESVKAQEEDAMPPHQLFTYEFQDRFKGHEDFNEDTLEENAVFNPEIFFYVLLPPIIFHAGYSMRRKAFFDNLGAILAFALLGTVISTLVIAMIVYGFAQFISDTVGFKFLDMLYFGAIISATDPVTVLTIFQDLNVDSMLNGLILGESLINDAVAIVLVGAIEEYDKLALADGGIFEPKALLFTVIKFFSVFFGSVFLGAFVGSCTALMAKFAKLTDYPVLETSLFSLMSYSSYLLAEISSMSGIVAVLFCGIFQAHYTFHNLSPTSQLRSKQLFEMLNFLSENFIFSYLGVTLFTYNHHIFSTIFIFGSFVAIAIGRALNIYPLSCFINCGRKHKIPINFQHMLWFSGLRGAMAFALALRNTVTDVRQMFFTTTCVITITTVIFNGGMAVSMLSLLEIPRYECGNERDGLLEQPDSLASNGVSSLTGLNGSGHKSKIAKLWKSFDKSFMKPLLTHSKPTLMETLPPLCMPCAELFSSESQLAASIVFQEEQ